MYVVWNEPEHYFLAALDHEGKTLWQRDFGPYVSQHACGTSPIVVGEKVILGWRFVPDRLPALKCLSNGVDLRKHFGGSPGSGIVVVRGMTLLLRIKKRIRNRVQIRSWFRFEIGVEWRVA